MSEPDREQSLHDWIKDTVGLGKFSVRLLAGDASFRRYFRVQTDSLNYVAMDAPPAKEDCHPFVDITRRLRSAQVNAPTIHHQNLEQGFLLLDDFGDALYLEQLSSSNADSLYQDALKTLLRIQSIDASTLPAYSHKLLLQEMGLFSEWFLQAHLGLELDDEVNSNLDQCFQQLAQSALAQPQVFVHRDYHSRNLVMTSSDNPGVLDYQDAVRGPVTYDLVSLLRDCYVAWPQAQVENWGLEYRDKAVANGIIQPVVDHAFLKWFDLMGIQRHLKAIGIFSRLNIRDSKPGYLNDIPRTLGYILDVGRHHAEVSELLEIINSHVPLGLIRA